MRYGVRDAGMMSKSAMSEWKCKVEPRKDVYHQSSIWGVDTSLLERFCPPVYNEFLQTLGVLPPGGGKIGVCSVRMFNERLPRLSKEGQKG